MHSQEKIEDEVHQLHRLAGFAATLNMFAPFDEGYQDPLRALQIQSKAVLRPLDSEVFSCKFAVREAYDEVFACFAQSPVNAVETKDSLYKLYMVATLAAFSLEDRFEVTGRWSARFKSREECIKFGWRLGPDRHSPDESDRIMKGIIEHYAKQGIRIRI